MRLTQIGTLVLTDKDARDSYPMSARSALEALRGGSYDFDGDQTILQATRITRRFILAGEKIDEQADHLKRMMTLPRQVAFVELRDGRERATYVKMDSFTPSVSTNDYECQEAYNLSWTRAYPRWWDTDHVDFLDTGLVLDGSWNFDGNFQEETIVASPHTFSIAYNGSVPGSMNTMVFVPNAASSIANILFENLTNGMSWRYAGTVAAETRLDVDNPTKTVMNNSTDDWDNFSFPDDKQLEIMKLALDGNNFRVTATVVGTVKLYFRWIGEFA